MLQRHQKNLKKWYAQQSTIITRDDKLKWTRRTKCVPASSHWLAAKKKTKTDCFCCTLDLIWCWFGNQSKYTVHYLHFFFFYHLLMKSIYQNVQRSSKSQSSWTNLAYNLIMFAKISPPNKCWQCHESNDTNCLILWDVALSKQLK